MGNRRQRPQREAPRVQPVDVDGVRTVAILTILWAIAFVVLAFNREQLNRSGDGWVLWTGLAGVGLGLLGLEYTRKRREAIAEALEEQHERERLEAAHAARSAGRSPSAGARSAGAPSATETGSSRGRAGRSRGQAQDSIPTGPIQPANRPPAQRPPSEPHVPSDPHRPSDPRPSQEQPPAGRAASPPLGAGPPVRPPQGYAVTDPGTGQIGAQQRAYRSPADPSPSLRSPSRGPQPRPQPTPTPGDDALTRPIQAPGTPPAPAPAPNPPASPPATQRKGRRQRRSSPDPSPPQQPADISPMWSELLDPPSAQRPASSRGESDEPLLGDTLGGRRARRYDMNRDIDEITEGGGGVYRGKRARRRPDSA